MNDNVWLALRQKLLLIEADQHRIGWHASAPLVHAITADASRLRYQLLTRPASVSASQPAHEQIHAHRAPARQLEAIGKPVAVCFTAELDDRGMPAGANPATTRVLTGLDIVGNRYLLVRKRETGHIITVVAPASAPKPLRSVDQRSFDALAQLLASHCHNAGTDINYDGDEPARCRTEGCEDDPDSGEGWDGYCGNCADRRFGAEQRQAYLCYGPTHWAAQPRSAGP